MSQAQYNLQPGPYRLGLHPMWMIYTSNHKPLAHPHNWLFYGYQNWWFDKSNDTHVCIQTFIMEIQYINWVVYSHKTTLTCVTQSSCPTIITCTFAYKPKPAVHLMLYPLSIMYLLSSYHVQNNLSLYNSLNDIHIQSKDYGKHSDTLHYTLHAHCNLAWYTQDHEYK